MSYTVHYSGERKERLARALQDARDYVQDDKRWDRIVIAISSILCHEGMRPRKKMRNCRIALSFAGIQGLPATAIIKYVISLLK